MKHAFWICLFAFLQLGNLGAEVIVQSVEQPLAVKGSNYEAQIATDGCLTNLAVEGLNFFAPGVSISRGSYFFRDAPLQLSVLPRTSEDVIEAENDQASIRYQFDKDRMHWRLTNRSDRELVHFIVLNGYVKTCQIGEGDLQKTPLNGQHQGARFFFDKSVLNITGFDKLWGPWHGPHQVVQTSLKPKESKTLTLIAEKASPDQMVQALQLHSVAEPGKLTIASPREMQVIQRRSREAGRLLVSGRTRTEATSIEVRFQGADLPAQLRDWQPIPVHKISREFRSWFTVPAGGWYALEIRARQDGRTLAEATIEKFGVGEVFVGAGQSNSTNSGEFKTKQTSGMVSSFGGSHWQLADDPQPGVADRTQGGSFWPAFGDAMYEKFGVPIGVATTGYGGTSVNQWQPDGDLYQRWLLTRIHQLGPDGFRAVLWHQGEADFNMPEEEYFRKLKNTIVSSTQTAGWEFPWFIAQASYHSPDKLRFENVRSAQRRLCDEGYALLGPDTDLLTGDNRDLEGLGIHLSPKGLKSHGRMWAEILAPYVEASLKNSSIVNHQGSP